MKTLRAVVAIATLIASAGALAHGRLADLAVYDRTEGRWLPLHWYQGNAYIVGRAGNEYQIRLRSRGEELLAVASVDGVNVITGETANPSQSGYVIARRGSVEIQGWRRSLSQTAAFYFTALPDSYAARTGRPNDVGVIGVALFRKKREPQPIAPIGPPSPHARSEAAAEQDARLGTGHGRHETSPATYVSFERASSAPAEVITVYYDSHANLVARGIIRDPVHVAPVQPPRPFPGFVPDPRS